MTLSLASQLSRLQQYGHFFPVDPLSKWKWEDPKGIPTDRTLILYDPLLHRESDPFEKARVLCLATSDDVANVQPIPFELVYAIARFNSYALGASLHDLNALFRQIYSNITWPDPRDDTKKLTIEDCLTHETKLTTFDVYIRRIKALLTDLDELAEALGTLNSNHPSFTHWMFYQDFYRAIIIEDHYYGKPISVPSQTTI